ncbi:hypothetical protein BEL04_08650 [Mucilaginibacter sp. PPCGB 2223]|uniref:hypothetical protein n=1 Tax=Mucilaginibacter sp. PPCGB 2223 TaxID=1886027 RepID=UPI000824F6EA|nr:hypothetical protein [Mucilaginibacter sp. PPCGB 2223]OCX54318.1 hypothetical protein BEL04_08650 [Mucilaginibacter sp. PPCGB 2223]
MEQTTYLAILDNLNAHDKPKYRAIVNAFKNWKLSGGKEIIDNVSNDYFVLKLPLLAVIDHLLKFKGVHSWLDVRDQYDEACKSQIKKFCVGGKIDKKEEYSKYLGRGFKEIAVSRCCPVHRMVSDIGCHPNNSLSEDECNLLRERLVKNSLTKDDKLMKFRVGKPFFPIWVTFVGEKDKFSAPTEFANGDFKHYQLRICLGLSPREDSFPQFVITYKLDKSERLRFPTVIDAGTYDFFSPTDKKEKSKHGYTANSSNSHEIFSRLMLSDNFKRMFKKELDEIEVEKINLSKPSAEIEKSIMAINEKIQKKIIEETFLKGRPESVYYSNRDIAISELLSYEVTLP